MVHEHNKLCDICGCPAHGIFKLLFELFTDGMFREFEERNPKIKQQLVICVYLLIWLFFNRQKWSGKNTFEFCLTQSALQSIDPLIWFQRDDSNLISIVMTFKYSVVWNYSLFYPKHTFCRLSRCKSQVWRCCWWVSSSQVDEVVFPWPAVCFPVGRCKPSPGLWLSQCQFQV